MFVILSYLLLTINPEIKKILENIRTAFGDRSTASQVQTIRRIIEGVRAKNLVPRLLVEDFSKKIDYISAEGLDSPKKYPGYDTKQSDSEAPLMLELWECGVPFHYQRS